MGQAHLPPQHLRMEAAISGLLLVLFCPVLESREAIRKPPKCGLSSGSCNFNHLEKDRDMKVHLFPLQVRHDVSG